MQARIAAVTISANGVPDQLTSGDVITAGDNGMDRFIGGADRKGRQCRVYSMVDRHRTFARQCACIAHGSRAYGEDRCTGLGGKIHSSMPPVADRIRSAECANHVPPTGACHRISPLLVGCGGGSRGAERQDYPQKKAEESASLGAHASWWRYGARWELLSTGIPCPRGVGRESVDTSRLWGLRTTWVNKKIRVA